MEFNAIFHYIQCSGDNNSEEKSETQAKNTWFDDKEKCATQENSNS